MSHDNRHTGPATLPCQAYLLAAGRGRRAGGPKAWSVHEGRALLEHQVDFLTTILEPQRTAISIQAEWRQRCRRLHGDIHWVPTDPDLPPLASLLALLEELPLTTWGFVWHVDMPVWHAGLFSDLMRATVDAPTDCDAVLPTIEGRGGHPLLLSPRAAPALSRLDPLHDRLDHWLRDSTVLRVAVSDPTIHENWNRPR